MQTADAQKLARRFNEDEAVWQAFERRKTMRKILGPQAPISEECSDNLDWQEADVQSVVKILSARLTVFRLKRMD